MLNRFPGPASRAIAFLVVLSAIPTTSLRAEDASAKKEVPKAETNDNRYPGGQMVNGTLTLDLNISEAKWFPEAENGPSLVVYALGEEGKPTQIPGPMVRVPEGTHIRASVRNRVAKKLYVHGLCQRPCDPKTDAMSLEPGERRSVEVSAGAPGTYAYFATSVPGDFLKAPDEAFPLTGIETPLGAAFIVDPAGSKPDDRVFVIGLWYDVPSNTEVRTINGRSWPFTERVHARVGEEQRWRVINTSLSEHSMHLHGFYYHVLSNGDGLKDELYDAGSQRQVVTEKVQPYHTFAMRFTPHTPGRWLYHCHMVAHMGENGMPEGFAKHEHGNPGMAGLVLGIDVTGDPESSLDARAPRKLRLLIEPRPGRNDTLAGYSFTPVVEDGGPKQPADPKGQAKPTLGMVGPPLILTRGERTEITVENHLDIPSAIHWHGMELESYYDGIADYSGLGVQMTPPIPPGGSFAARMTPRHAGTFIYHSHWHDDNQIRGGLVGPLIVVEPGEKFDPATDKIFLVTMQGIRDAKNYLAVNGSPQPTPIEIEAGTRYRFRLINLTTNQADLTVTLRNAKDNTTVQWRAWAKDGLDLPTQQRLVEEAKQAITVGETYDFEVQPAEPGEMVLEVRSPFDRRVVLAPIFIRSKKAVTAAK
jgi:FtsP/CotA-like multicopper oxidase with cupredoxin domain